MAGRKLAIVRRFSLKDLADGWDDCYLEYTPATLADLRDIQDVKTDDLDVDKGARLVVDFAKNHVVGGLIKILDDSGKSVDAAATSDDLEGLPPSTINDLFSAITGAQYLDPKALTKEPRSDVQPDSPEAPTETPSSEA